MSNLNDFIGGNGITYYYHSGTSVWTGTGSPSWDVELTAPVSTSNTYGQENECKLHNVFDNRIFPRSIGHDNSNGMLKLYFSDPGGSPPFGGAWYDNPNLLPIALEVVKSFSVLYYIKKASEGSYTLLETVSFSGASALDSSNGVTILSTTNPKLHATTRVQVNSQSGGSSNFNSSSYDTSATRNITVTCTTTNNINDAFIDTDTNEAYQVKVAVAMNPTIFNGAWGQAWDAFEGIKFQSSFDLECDSGQAPHGSRGF